MTWTIKVVACLVGLFFWSTVGMLIAITILIRVMVAFSIKATLQAFKEQDMSAINKSVQTALAFWPDGVKRVLMILSKEGTAEREKPIPWNMVLPSLVREIAYLAALWFPIFAYYWLTTNTSSNVPELLNHLPNSVEVPDKIPFIAFLLGQGLVLGALFLVLGWLRLRWWFALLLLPIAAFAGALVLATKTAGFNG